MTPGLAFLPPHVQQFRYNKRKALCEVYSFLLREPALAQRQELGGKEREDLGKKLSWITWTRATIKGGFSCLARKYVKESGSPLYI